MTLRTPTVANLIANAVSRPFAMLLSIFFIPIYLRMVGVEAYALIGVYGVIAAIFGLMDCGIGATLNRELARRNLRDAGAQAEAASLTRTLEAVYWLIGGIGSGLLWICAPIVAERWLHTALPSSTVVSALRVCACAFFFQWPVSFYANAISGLQRQVALNIVAVAVAFGRTFGAVVALSIFEPTIVTFFAWQTVINVLHVGCLLALTWRSISWKHVTTGVSIASIAGTMRFAGGTFALGLLGAALTQADKLVLSRNLPLESFGYYTVAASIVNGLLAFSNAVYTAVFPRFCQMTGPRDVTRLRDLYHLSCQATASVVIPCCAVLVLFSHEIVFAWTNSAAIADRTDSVLGLLAIGGGLNARMAMPLALQLSHGWLRLSVWKNVVAIVLFVPCLVFLTRSWGGAGAAAAWALLNLGYVVVEVPIMHRRLLLGSAGRWYLQDCGKVMIASLIVTVLVRLAAPDDCHRISAAVWVGAALSLSVAACLVVATSTRRWLMAALHGVRFGAV